MDSGPLSEVVRVVYRILEEVILFSHLGLFFATLYTVGGPPFSIHNGEDNITTHTALLDVCKAYS